MTDDRCLEPQDFKYLRPGHVNLERNCDELVVYATSLLPGKVLPKRWKWVSQESFNRRHGDLGPMVWAKTASYHMLMINGRHAFRIWTDSPDTALVDLDTVVARDLSDTFEVLDIPKSTYRKTKPFKKRIRISSHRHVQILILQTLKTFGVS